MKCNFCGAMVNDNLTFCERCGTRLSKQPGDNGSGGKTPTGTTHKKKSVGRKILNIFLIIAGLAVVINIARIAIERENKRERYMALVERALENDDCDNAQQHYGSYEEVGGNDYNIESRIKACLKKEEDNRSEARLNGYYRLGGLLVSINFFGEKTWDEAKRMVGNTTIGGTSNGWRLPTGDELIEIYKNQKKIWGKYKSPWRKYERVWRDGGACKNGSFCRYSIRYDLLGNVCGYECASIYETGSVILVK